MEYANRSYEEYKYLQLLIYKYLGIPDMDLTLSNCGYYSF